MTTIGDRTLISTIYDRLLIDDDTQESVTGPDFHLIAILALYDVLNRYAHRTRQAWYVTAEVMVLVDVLDRSRNPWTPMPDVYVVLDTADVPRTSLDTRTGTAFPQFICEVASESTWGQDVGEKQRLYADLGTREYIAFDPTAQFLGQPMRAWRRGPDETWVTWEPDDEGFLTSDVLGLRLRAEDQLLRVYHPEEGRLPIARELEQEQRAQAKRLAEIERERREQQVRIAALEAEIARLRKEQER